MRTLSILVALFAVITLQPAPAAASGCYLGPFVADIDVPSGCEVFAWHQTATQPTAPAVYVMRDGQMVDVAGTIIKETTTLGVEWPEYNCKGEVTSVMTRDETYDLYRISLDGALLGEELIVDGQPAGKIAASGSCFQPIQPVPVCGMLPPACGEEDEDTGGGGCNTSGRDGALAMGLLALALVLRARR